MEEELLICRIEVLKEARTMLEFENTYAFKMITGLIDKTKKDLEDERI